MGYKAFLSLFMTDTLKLKKVISFFVGVTFTMMVAGFSLPVIKSGLYAADAFQHKRSFTELRKTFYRYKPLLEANKVIPRVPPCRSFRPLG